MIIFRVNPVYWSKKKDECSMTQEKVNSNVLKGDRVN